jgi:hypothetical protein
MKLITGGDAILFTYELPLLEYELNFRQGVFESRLAAGDGISEAADAARRRALDYGEVPGPVRDQVAKLVAEAAEYWQLTVELVKRAAKSPQIATAFYKSMMA